MGFLKFLPDSITPELLNWILVHFGDVVVWAKNIVWST